MKRFSLLGTMIFISFAIEAQKIKTGKRNWMRYLILLIKISCLENCPHGGTANVDCS